MWFKHYRDYPHDRSMVQEQVEPSHGIIGCEMHDLYGWGTQYHIPKKRKKGRLTSWLERLFKGHKNNG